MTTSVTDHGLHGTLPKLQVNKKEANREAEHFSIRADKGAKLPTTTAGLVLIFENNPMRLQPLMFTVCCPGSRLSF